MPVRKLLVGGVAFAVVVAAAFALVSPSVDRAKQEGAAGRARQQATADAAVRVSGSAVTR